MQEKYQLKDASNVYILAIIVPLIVSFMFSFILSLLATIFKTNAAELLSNIWVYAIALLVSQGSFLGVVIIYNKINKIKISTSTTINKSISFWQILIVAIMSVSSLFLFLPLVNMFDTLIRMLGYTNSGSLPFAINSWWSFIVALIVLAALPAVCEEMVFRGVLFNGLKNTLGAKKAVIFSAICFCIMHMSLQQTIYPLLLGIVLALIVYHTGSVRASIFAHFLNNAIVVLSNFIASFSSTEAEEVSFVFNATNIITAVVCCLIGVAVILGCCYLLKKLKNKKSESHNEMVESGTIEQQLSMSAIDEQTKENFKKAKLKAELKTFYVFLGISIFLWIIQNIMYF